MFSKIMSIFLLNIEASIMQISQIVPVVRYKKNSPPNMHIVAGTITFSLQLIRGIHNKIRKFNTILGNHKHCLEFSLCSLWMMDCGLRTVDYGL